MTLILTRGDVVTLLTLDACIAAVEQAFALQGESRALGPGILGLHVPDGGFHVKAAGLPLSRLYVAVKVNANFPENGRRRGLPTIQGVLALSDGESGRPLALMDSMEITVLRTGAATAVAARHLARPDARTATIVGCGRQGRIQLAALARVRLLERAYAVDTDAAVARRFAKETSAQLGLDVRPAGSAAEAAPLSDICVTCTPSRHPLLRREDIAAGAFIAAVGADSEDKVEIEPALMAAGTVVVDNLEQCATIRRSPPRARVRRPRHRRRARDARRRGRRPAAGPDIRRGDHHLRQHRGGDRGRGGRGSGLRRRPGPGAWRHDRSGRMSAR